MPASCGVVYFLIIVDDFSHAIWVYFLLKKSEVLQIIIDCQFKKQVKIVCSENGTEFTCLWSYFETHGMLHQTLCVGTTWQNR